jgi:hypothetical protein
MEMAFMKHHEAEAKQLRDSKKRYGNKLLAVKVQALEAYFFHTLVVSHMESNYKHAPYAIKHDSITMPETIAHQVYTELNEMAKAFFGRNEIELKWQEK